MNEQKQGENGNEPRQELIMNISNIKRRSMTATLVWALVGDEATARFDAEVDRLLGELARAAIKNERNCHGSSSA